MQNIFLNILKYIALAAAIYLIFRFVPNSCMSNVDILIITVIILLVYIIFDYLFNLGNNTCTNNLNNLTSDETNKLCNTVCNVNKESMSNVNNNNHNSNFNNNSYHHIPSEENIFYSTPNIPKNINPNVNNVNNDRNSISVNVSVNEDDDVTESQDLDDYDEGYDESGFIYDNYRPNYYDYNMYNVNTKNFRPQSNKCGQKINKYKNKNTKQYYPNENKWYPQLNVPIDNNRINNNYCPPCPPCPACPTINNNEFGASLE